MYSAWALKSDVHGVVMLIVRPSGSTRKESAPPCVWVEGTTNLACDVCKVGRDADSDGCVVVTHLCDPSGSNSTG